MKKEGINPIIIIGAFVLFGLSVGLSFFYIFNLQESNDKYFRNYNKNEENELSAILKYQNDTDKKIEHALDSLMYSFDDPYVVENPYKINPLSAVIAFYTKKKESIDVIINDVFAYTVKASKRHVIPIYGLYNNAVNIITLKMGNKSKEIEIKTDIYNDDHEGIDMSKNVGDKTHYFLLGNTNSKESNLRGFDKLGNLIYYLDLDYISGVKFYNTRLYVGYNSKYSKDNNLSDVKLEMDYLGKIYGISTNLSDLEMKDNVDNKIDDDVYVGNNINIYRKSINNQDLTKSKDTIKYTEYSKISTKEISNELDDALIYDKSFRIASNGEYLTYDIDDEGMLVLVNKNTFYTYMYSLDNTNMIKIEPLGQSAVYLYKDGKYYTLLTTVIK